MKYLLLVGDGMGDHPIPELGNKTPLEAASTPAMDELCRHSTLFEVATVPDGLHPGSDVANMSLLGYDPTIYYTGRAPLEAASMGIDLAVDETAFRCNLVTLEHEDERTRLVDFSAGHISNEEAAELIAAIEQRCGSERFRFCAGISYRHLLVVKDAVAEVATVPPHDYIGKEVTDHFRSYLAAPEWARLVHEAQRILAEHPVNRRRIEQKKRPATSIWPWGSGKMPSMPTLEARFKINGTMISAVDLLNGLGVCVGLDIAKVEGATGYIDTNYEGKAEAAIAALEKQDFVFVHLEAPDEAGHQGRLDHKIQAIEDFDQRIVAPIIASLRARQEPFRAVVTMDHFTPLSLRTHTAEAVPALIYDSRQKINGSDFSLDERLLSGDNGLTPIAGYTLIEYLLEKRTQHG
ncbi:MAG: cofactor-independent phosphoglycerate mutase [Desulfofustis sp.]|jgi:2,3-bisphosphoglycerate-independent phosphoglycerate mutase